MFGSKRVKSLIFMICIAFIIWSNNYAPLGKNAGFFCNDTSIKKPYFGDSINVIHLFITLLTGPALVIYITESFHPAKDVIRRRLQFNFNYKSYLKGFFYVLVVTELLKYSIKEMRPHFYETCRPDVDSIKCSKGLVTNFKCTASGPNWLLERDIYKSFPSGHASLSFYAFVFLTLYIKDKPMELAHRFTLLWKLAVVAVFFLWSTVCCITRLLDNRHFWWDVLCGLVLGFLGALLNAYILRQNSLKRLKSS